MKATVNFRNKNQVTLWNNEILGQLSDGYWENTRPHNHWCVWHSAEAVCDESLPVGRNFFAIKANYNFTAKDLLEIVGQRMINSVRLTNAGFGDVAHHKFEDIGIEMCYMDQFNKYKPATKEMIKSDIESWKNSESKYYSDKYDLFTKTFGSDETEAIEKYFSIVNDETLYSAKQLRKDLDDMKKIIKEKV